MIVLCFFPFPLRVGKYVSFQILLVSPLAASLTIRPADRGWKSNETLEGHRLSTPTFTEAPGEACSRKKCFYIMLEVKDYTGTRVTLLRLYWENYKMLIFLLPSRHYPPSSLFLNAYKLLMMNSNLKTLPWLFIISDT